MYDIRGIDGTHTTANPAPISESKGYTIRKLADGNCWMAENLQLPLTAGVNVERSYYNGSVDMFSPVSCDDDNCSINGNTKQSSDGWRYSWYAAVAQTGDVSMANITTSGSICPKGWLLPRADANDLKSYGNLMSSYGLSRSNEYNSEGWQKLEAIPLSFIRGGYTVAGIIKYPEVGYYWTSSAHATDPVNAYELAFSTDIVFPQGHDAKYAGEFVRCVNSQYVR